MKSSSVRTVLQLMRFPAVFTALADILLGAGLVAAASGEWSPLVPAWKLILLLVASAGLYLSGMVFNDVFDVEQDRRERPGRPIPSGRITRRMAALWGTGLMAGGVLAAACVGRQSLLIAGLLAGGVLLYDGVLKATPAAAWMMGCCRLMNVLLGASIVSSWSGAQLVASLDRQALLVSLGTGLYIVGVTLFARQEAGPSEPRRLWLALAVLDCGLGGLMALMLSGQLQTAVSQRTAALLVLMVAFFVNHRARWAIRRASPEAVQATVRTMLMSIPMLDAVLLQGLTGHGSLSAATALLVLPAMLIGRWLYVT